MILNIKDDWCLEVGGITYSFRERSASNEIYVSVMLVIEKYWGNGVYLQTGADASDHACWAIREMGFLLCGGVSKDPVRIGSSSYTERLVWDFFLSKMVALRYICKEKAIFERKRFPVFNLGWCRNRISQ